MIDILSIINDKSKLNADTLPLLEGLVEKYPFFQTARILYVANLFLQHDKRFGEELRKASVFVQDRTPLFLMTEGMHYNVEHIEQLVNNIETENDSNRTISLIDSFLSQSHDRGEGDEEIHRDQPSITDLTTDYASFLMQKDTEDTNITDTPKLKGSDLIDSFIQETQGKQRIDMPDLQDKEDSEFISPDITSEDEEILTETMVNIYIKQGRYEQALKILRKICLNNPKKNAYFANQIDLLEVITEQK